MRAIDRPRNRSTTQRRAAAYRRWLNEDQSANGRHWNRTERDLCYAAWDAGYDVGYWEGYVASRRDAEGLLVQEGQR